MHCTNRVVVLLLVVVVILLLLLLLYGVSKKVCSEKVPGKNLKSKSFFTMHIPS